MNPNFEQLLKLKVESAKRETKASLRNALSIADRISQIAAGIKFHAEAGELMQVEWKLSELAQLAPQWLSPVTKQLAEAELLQRLAQEAQDAQ